MHQPINHPNHNFNKSNNKYYNKTLINHHNFNHCIKKINIYQLHFMHNKIYNNINNNLHNNSNNNNLNNHNHYNNKIFLNQLNYYKNSHINNNIIFIKEFQIVLSMSFGLTSE